MSLLPIVERELRVVARKASIYRTRTLVALLSTGVTLIFLAAGYFSGSTRLGGQVFSALVIVAFVYCLIEGLRAADAISEERREGTLGLLFLTDLRGYDVVFGKLAAVAVRSLHGLLAFLPVLAMALILGGVTAGEFWRSALTLLNTLFFSLAIALCISALSRQTHRAISGTIVALTLITVGPLLLRSPLPGWLSPVGPWLVIVSPASAIRDAQDVWYRTASAEFWASIGATHGLAWLALAAAGVIVPSSWRERQSRRAPLFDEERWQRWRAGEPETRVAARQQRLTVNPFYWLSGRFQRDPLLISLVFGSISLFGIVGWLAGVAEFFVWLCSFCGTLLLLAWIGWRAAQTFSEARQSGAMELLLVVPGRAEDMIQGQWLALKDLFILPAAFVLLLRLVARFATGGAANTPWPVGLLQWVSSGFDALSFVVSLLAFFWLGLWMGISRPKPLQAFLYTMLIGLILPAVLVCLPNIAIHLGLMSWARTRLRRDFRRVASGESTAHRQARPVR